MTNEPISIVRDGNHFLRADGIWFLIDGPWYDKLMNVEKYVIRTYDWPMPHYSLTPPETITVLPRTVTWQRGRWHPGGFRSSLWDYSLEQKWEKWNRSRVRIGFRMADGHLPSNFTDTIYEKSL